MVIAGIDPTLVERVRRGEYVVDEHAVAEAVLRRWRGSPMLVAEQAGDRTPVLADEDGPLAADDLA
jgi:hypothetical protein